MRWRPWRLDSGRGYQTGTCIPAEPPAPVGAEAESPVNEAIRGPVYIPDFGPVSASPFTVVCSARAASDSSSPSLRLGPVTPTEPARFGAD